MKKVIVTGALGFIGFSLCQRLLNYGYEVIGIDGMVDKRLQEFHEEKLLWIGRNSSFHFIGKKIEELDLTTLFQDIDVVYHLAAVTSRDRNWGVLQEIIEENVSVTKKILSTGDSKIKLIFTSSTQVYGIRTGIITEKTPLNPITPYSLTKMVAESLIKSEHKASGIPYVIFRLPTIYGPWQRVDMTYSKLIINQLKGTDNAVDHDRVTEDILYIDDILDTLIEAGKKADCKNEIFNLGSGKPNEWFRGQAIITNDVRCLPNDKRLQVSINNEKVATNLGFKVLTTLENGISTQKEHFVKYKHLYLS